LYTGQNAARHIGKHLFGFPNADLRKLIREYSVFVKLQEKNIPCKFINAFRPVFFTTPEIFQNLHMSATSEMNKYARLPFSDFKQIKDKKALYHDYTNNEVQSIGFQLPSFTAHEAADVLIGQSENYALVLYEYFLTDFAGHARDLDRAVSEIKKIEKLIQAILTKIQSDTTTLIVVSDHGNIEDLRTKSHTLNPAFMGIWKSKSVDILPAFNSLEDIHPFLLSVLNAV
jgi:2,3-bisphosphoglycerate-independent phosphoglycerate mutase